MPPPTSNQMFADVCFAHALLELGRGASSKSFSEDAVTYLVTGGRRRFRGIIKKHGTKVWDQKQSRRVLQGARKIGKNAARKTKGRVISLDSLKAAQEAAYKSDPDPKHPEFP